MDKHPIHVENAYSTVSDQDPFNYEKLNYGNNGLSGILSSPYVFGAAFLASMGGFSFGYDQGVISLILTMTQFHDQFPETAPDHHSNGFYVGFMVSQEPYMFTLFPSLIILQTSMLELGAFLGCLAFPLFADRFSRKWGLTAAVVWFCIGAVLQTAAQNYGMLVAGRTIGGVGVGTLALGAPLYISEIAPPNLRGSLLVLETFSIVIGGMPISSSPVVANGFIGLTFPAIIAYWLTYGTSEIQSHWAWRLPFLLQMIPALMVGVGIHFFPFSPRWLCMRNRDDDSLKALCTLRRLPPDDPRVQLEWKGIMAEVRVESEVHRRRHGETSAVMREINGWLDLFKPRYRKRTMVAVAIPFFQQFSGIVS